MMGADCKICGEFQDTKKGCDCKRTYRRPKK